MTLSDSTRTEAGRHGSGSFILSWERAHRVTLKFSPAARDCE